MKIAFKQNGLAMVEFTILLPLFLLLLFSIMELGRAFYTYAELEKLSRDSARYLSAEVAKGSATPTLQAEDVTKAKNLAIYGVISGGTNALISNLDTSHIHFILVGNNIKVEINYPYQPVLSFIPGFYNSNDIDLGFTLTSSYSMRVL